MSPAEQKIIERLELLFPAFQTSNVTRISEKGAVVFGRFDSQAAVAKLLYSGNADWDAWFAQELRCYQVAERDSPPVNMSRLLAVSDDKNAFITLYIEGNVVAPNRFYPTTLGPTVMPLLIDHLEKLSSWAPLQSGFSIQTIRDVVEKAAQQVSRGYLMPDDYQALTQVVPISEPAPRFAHGDPVASNVLWNQDALSLIDWEFSGFKPAGFDLAVLWVMCADTPQARMRIATFLEGREQKFVASFVCTLIRLLGREIGNSSQYVLPESESRIKAFRASLEQIRKMIRQRDAGGKLDVRLIV